MSEPELPMGQRIMSAIFGCVFGGIGLLVISSLWGAPMGGFHSPPIFFRMFGSLVAIPFVAIGAAGIWGAISGKVVGQQKRFHRTSRLIDKMMDQAESQMNRPARNLPESCPHCNAPRGNSEVSPSGDIRCSHCNQWY